MTSNPHPGSTQSDLHANKPPILVTGATGRHGGSGRAVVKDLIERGFTTRALVRSLDNRAEDLQRLGAEVVVGDFCDYSSLLAALQGVKSAYFCYPVAAGIVEAAGLFAAAGREQGLGRIVDLSLGGTSPEAASPQLRAQSVAEKIFEWAGFDGVHLRIKAFFMENVPLMDSYTIRTNGNIANAFGDNRLSWIAGADVGSMAASLLMNPALTSERVITAGGVENLTYSEVAATISSIVGKSIPYRELTPDEWRSALIAASATKGEANVRGADHLVAQAKYFGKRQFSPAADCVRQLTGRAPISFADFVRSRRAELTPP